MSVVLPTCAVARAAKGSASRRRIAVREQARASDTEALGWRTEAR
jgi:hypothetical protein